MEKKMVEKTQTWPSKNGFTCIDGIPQNKETWWRLMGLFPYLKIFIHNLLWLRDFFRQKIMTVCWMAEEKPLEYRRHYYRGILTVIFLVLSKMCNLKCVTEYFNTYWHELLTHIKQTESSHFALVQKVSCLMPEKSGLL